MNVEITDNNKKRQSFLDYHATGGAGLNYAGFECLNGIFQFALDGVTDVTGYGGCFTSETLVETENGSKKIFDIKVGDMVWSYNHDTNKRELRKVLNIFHHGITQDRLFKIKMKDGSVIQVTENHEFFYQGKYTKIKDIICKKK